MSERRLARPEVGLGQALLGRLRELAESDDRIRALYVYGSRSRGEQREDSDLDLGVLLDRELEVYELLRLAERLERELDQRVDLVDVARCSPFLALDVIDGHRVFARDEGVDEFELYVLRRAGDLAPLERQRRAMLLQNEAPS